MKVEKVIRNYLLGLDLETKEVKTDIIEGDKFINKEKCFTEDLKSIFDCDISCELYNQVVNGEGNEKDKIDSVYSSSLQSLLFFSQVSKNNKLTVNIGGNNIEFEHVQFEYKNKVIGYPSSVDVVLSDKGGKNILFIESKLAEIARDSAKKEDGDINPGKKVVGISYFMKNKDSGYYTALKLGKDETKDEPKKEAKDELRQLGIIFPENEGDYPISKRKNEGTNDALITLPNDAAANTEYVYSEGIKQILAHIIGIINFKQGRNSEDARCSNELRTYEKNSNVYYMELYNGFPVSKKNGENQKELEKIRFIQDEFKKHVKVVFNVLSKKNLNITMLDMTYQKLYKNRGKYDIPKKIVDFYHLDE